MRTFLGLVLLSTLGQLILVASAPIKRNSFQSLELTTNDTTIDNINKRSKVLKFLLDPVNVDPKVQPTTFTNRALTNAVTRMYCVALVVQPTPQVRIYPDVHGCNQAGHIHIYSFLGYKSRIEGIATQPWSYCENPTGTEFKALIQSKEVCGGGDWKDITGGFSVDKDLEQNSFISRTATSQMMMNPWEHFTAQPGYDDKWYLHHLGIFMAATVSEVDWVTNHVETFPRIWRPAGWIKGTRHFKDYTHEEMLAAQLFIGHLPSLTAIKGQPQMKIVNPGTYTQDRITAGLKEPMPNIYLHGLLEPIMGADEGRMAFSIIFIDNEPGAITQWMAGFTLQVGYTLTSQQVQTVLTESLREHSLVMVGKGPEKRWIAAPIPNDNYPGYPPIYALRD